MKIKTMLVGLGFMGSKWADVIAASDKFELSAIVDSDAAKCTAIRGKYPDAATFASVREALGRVDFGAAVIATPAFTHCEVFQQIASHAIPMVIEKPLDTDWAKARRIAADSAALNIPVLVDQNYRFTAPIVTLKNQLQSGAIGQPGFATVIHHRNRKGTGTYQQNMPDPMLLDMSTHHLDTMRYVFGREAVSVTAHSWNPNWSDYTGDANIDMLIEFEGGLWVTYSGSNVSRGVSIHPFANWRIECTDGGLYLESSGFDLELYTVPIGSPPKFKQNVQFESLKHENQAHVLCHLHECIINKSSTCISAQDNLNTLAIAIAAIESSRQGRRVYIREILER